MMRGKLFVHETREDFEAWLKSAETRQNQHMPDTTKPPVPGGS
jgi:hypothetical protein